MGLQTIMPIRGRALALVASLALAGCSSLQPRPELPEQSAVPMATGTVLDELIGKAEAANPGKSGFRLLREGPEAFVLRSRSALMAGRSLDVQTYIWHVDDTGAFLVKRVLEAADRGVKVRLLVDDMDARSKHYAFAALAAHPGIDVRMFNPFGSRTGSLRFAFEALGSFSRINRRMHNKTWIVDNRIAIVGGRNLGDEYFGASDEVNFVDLDFAMVGPIVREASASFDRYWNSPAAYPMRLLDPAAVSAEALAQLRLAVADLVPKAATHPFAQELARQRFDPAPHRRRLADALDCGLPLRRRRPRQGTRQAPWAGRFEGAGSHRTGTAGRRAPDHRHLAVLRPGRGRHGIPGATGGSWRRACGC